MPSMELISAAQKGDLRKVLEIIANGEVNVNFQQATVNSIS